MKFCQNKLTLLRSFELFLRFCILGQLFYMGFRDYQYKHYGYENQPVKNQICFWLEMAINIIFGLEILIKCVAKKAITGKTAHLRNPGAILDLVFVGLRYEFIKTQKKRILVYYHIYQTKFAKSSSEL